MQIKKKDVYNFFLQYLHHSDVTKWGTVFHLHQRAYMWWGYLHTYYIFIFLRLLHLIWFKKKSIETLT